MSQRVMPLRLQKYAMKKVEIDFENKSNTNTRKIPFQLQKYPIKKVACVENKPNTETRKISSNFAIDNASLPNSLFNIDIVYFANLFVNRHYGAQLITLQLKDLISTGLTQISRINIVLSVPPDFDYHSMQTDLRSLFKDPHNVVFNINHENIHEYPGIQIVYSIANANNSDSHYILYFHSKSMTRFRGIRENVEIALHNTVIARWKDALDIFRTHPEIDKIGSSIAPDGSIWFNYWWVRSSFIVKVESPIRTERRHYYEEWLSRVLKDQNHSKDPHRLELGWGSPPLYAWISQVFYIFDQSNCWGLSYKENNSGRDCLPPEAFSVLLY